MRPQVKRAGETPFVPQDEPALRKCRGAVNSMRSLSHFFGAGRNEVSDCAGRRPAVQTARQKATASGGFRGVKCE